MQHAAVDRELATLPLAAGLLDRTFRRGARYLHYIVGEIEKRGMPMELALLPVVESAFNPVAYSSSRASGLWQFMPRTGRHYGLDQTWWLDERRDVIESTQAALTYLRVPAPLLRRRLVPGDRGVQRRRGHGEPRDADERPLRPRHRFLRPQRCAPRRASTCPKLLAIRRIVADPQAFGLQFAPIPNRPYFDVVDPGRQVHIGNAAELAGVSQDDMFALNPAYNRQTTPPRRPASAAVAGRAAPTVLRQAMLVPENGDRLWIAAVKEPVHQHATTCEGARRCRRSRATTACRSAELKAANEMTGSTIIPASGC